MEKTHTCTAPVNIAVIKYCKYLRSLRKKISLLYSCNFKLNGLYCTINVLAVDKIMFSGGKRHEDLILPINSSLSVTLHQDQVKK